MRLKTTNRTEIEEVDFGVVLWKMPDGAYVQDDEGRFLNLRYWSKAEIPGLQRAMAKFVKAEFGIEEGEAVYSSGHRPVNQEEFEEQKARLKAGLIPDKFDVGAAREEMKRVRSGRR